MGAWGQGPLKKKRDVKEMRVTKLTAKEEGRSEVETMRRNK